ncbi:RICIN domain-containing protein [Actinosynnema sp. NPDC091369]
MVRNVLYRSLRRAFDDSGIPWDACHREDRGDGVFLLVPPDVPKTLVVERLPGALAEALAEHDSAVRREGERVRVRMAVHAGEVHPDRQGFTSASINLAFRLVEAPQLKSAPAGSPGVPALVLSSWCYDEVAWHSRVLDPRTFRRVDVAVKGTTATAWIARPDHPYPPARPGDAIRWGRAALVLVSVIALSMATAADHPGTRGGAVDHVGEAFPGEREFLAHVVNLKTGKCLARNGVYTQPDDSESDGGDIYQWDCADSHNPGHHVVPAPAGGGDWAIRSSVRADLCLAADDEPETDQHFRACRPGDDRQRWRVRRIRGRAPDAVVVENRGTGGCLAHQGGRPDVHIQVFRRDCRPFGQDEVAWSIRPYAMPGRRSCREPWRGPVRDNATGLHLTDGDGAAHRAASAAPAVSVVAVGESAHGCRVTISGTPGTWVLESPAAEDWVRVHAAGNVSECLAAVDGAVVTRRCDGSRSQQWRLG